MPGEEGENLIEENAMEIESEGSKVRRLEEERDDVAIIIDSGADVALFPEYGRSWGSRARV